MIYCEGEVEVWLIKKISKWIVNEWIINYDNISNELWCVLWIAIYELLIMNYAF